MPSYLDHYFGLQSAARRTLNAAVLTITDGDLSVDLTGGDLGWALLENGWQMKSPPLKTYYADSKMAHGQQLRYAAFDNVVESWEVKLNFYSADGLLDQWDMLEELLKVRAPRYWTDRRYHKPVYVKRQLSGETNPAYYLINEGSLLCPQTIWNRVSTLANGVLQPILLTYSRQPFTLGAAPGEVQGTVELSAQQDWDYNLLWAEEDTLPGGSVFCFAELSNGHIYAGGASEILFWNGTVWAVANTAPVGLAADVTSVVKMSNGDLIFGESGRTILRTAAGAWSVEDATPGGQVEALLLANDGNVWAGENGQILKRTPAGVWSVDDTLPTGYVYSLVQAGTGRIFAGGVGEILAQVPEASQTSTTVTTQIAALTDNAEQYGTQTYTNPTVDSDLDLLNQNYVGMRWQLNVPANATINNAHIKWVQCRDVTGNTYAGKIYCEDTDDAATFAAVANDISSRTLTTAYVAWQDTVIRRRNHWWQSLDLTEPLQEVIDRAGWAADQHVVVIVKCDTLASGIPSGGYSRDVFGYDVSPAKSPMLVVEYTPAPVANAGWEINSTLPGGSVRSMLEVGNLLLAGESGQTLASDDMGETWAVADTTPTGEVRALYDDGDNVWAGDNGNILKSWDGGRNWETDSTLPTGYVHAFIEETATGDMRAGDSGRILILDASDAVTLGRDETDTDEVFVANKHNTANITHVKIDNGGAFSDIFPAAAFPQTLLPAVPAVDDAVYFGCNTSLDDTGPFCSLIFDIATPAVSTTSYTITWEYYIGAAWAALTAQDETTQLSEPGVNGIFWKQPSDWAAAAVNGVTGYWIRGRVSALVGVLTPPAQQNRDIYSVVWPCVELDHGQTRGNTDSLIKLEIHNRSDNGGPGGSEPLLYQNRIIAGVKETEGHGNFRAFLNFAAEQNPDGVTVDVSVDTDSATSLEADTNLSSATGRRAFFDAGIAAAGVGLNNLADRVEFELDTTIARDYYGTYKAFLRCKQEGGSAGEVSVRLKVLSGSGGISSLSDTQVTASTTDHELIEFDVPATIPVSSQFTDTDIGDVTSVVVQISCAADDADLYLYGLGLIPTDLIWIDSEDQANTAESSVENGRRLVVDSIDIPKAPTRALVQKLASDAFVSSWRVDGNGKARLLATTEQRIWFLSARTVSAGSSVWISEPEVCCSVKVSKVDRWLLGRGAA